MAGLFRLGLFAGCVLTLTGCAVDPEPNADETAQSTQAIGGVDDPYKFRLSGDSVIVTGDTAQNLSFGHEQADAIAAVAVAAGDVGEVVQNDECGAGPMEFAAFDNGLTLNFQDGKLIGWLLRDGDDQGSIATTKDIGFGSSQSDLAATYDVEEIPDSTLGDESYTDERIGGFFTEFEGEKVIESLHAGTNCFFR